MASGVILRRRKILSDYLSPSLRPIQTFHTFGCGQSCSPGYTSIRDRNPQNIDQLRENEKTSALCKKPLDPVALGIFMHKAYEITALRYGNGRSDFNCLIGARMISQSRCYASTATARQPDPGSDKEDTEEMTAKRKKEASPEECDQAVVGLSTAKAKAKAKKLQESQITVKPILKKMWATFLGIGPALRAVASMSRSDFLFNLSTCSTYMFN